MSLHEVCLHHSHWQERCLGSSLAAYKVIVGAFDRGGFGHLNPCLPSFLAYLQWLDMPTIRDILVDHTVSASGVSTARLLTWTIFSPPFGNTGLARGMPNVL